MALISSPRHFSTSTTRLMHTSSNTTSDRSIRWIENLAEQELSISEGRSANVDICSTKEEVLLEETSHFLREIAHHLSYLSKLFNAKMEKVEFQIKVKRGSSPGDGLTLVRGDVRLHLRSQNAASVQLQCLRSDLTQGKESVLSSGLIEAQFVTFHDIEWQFLGVRVTAEQVARHYMTEFLQVSRHLS